MVCVQKSEKGRVQKMGQNQQNLRQTAISQAKNKLFTNFQRLESTTIHGLPNFTHYYLKLWLW